MKCIQDLPCDILINIYEYNPEHREKFYWILEDIRHLQYCYCCDKIIMKKVYSMRRCHETFCSFDCLESYTGV